jgi:hypothetical protein
MFINGVGDKFTNGVKDFPILHRGWLAALVARNNKPASSAYRAKPNKTRASRRREGSKN